ncbi:hypothetical protein S83_001481 [Arachis hypogaea]
MASKYGSWLRLERPWQGRQLRRGRFFSSLGCSTLLLPVLGGIFEAEDIRSRACIILAGGSVVQKNLESDEVLAVDVSCIVAVLV